MFKKNICFFHISEEITITKKCPKTERHCAAQCADQKIE